MKPKLLQSVAFCILGQCLAFAQSDSPHSRLAEDYQLRKSANAERAKFEIWTSAKDDKPAERLATLPVLLGQRDFPDMKPELVHVVADKHELGVILRVDATGRFPSESGNVPRSKFDYTYLLWTKDIKASLDGTGAVPMPNYTVGPDPYLGLERRPLVWIQNPDMLGRSEWPWTTQMETPRKFSFTAEIDGQKVTRKFEYDVMSFRMDGEPQRIGLYGGSDFVRFYRPEDARRLAEEILSFGPKSPETIQNMAGDLFVERFGGFDGLETFFRPHVENEEVLQKFLDQVRAIQRFQAEKAAEWAAGEEARSRANIERLKREEEERRQRVKEMDAKADKIDRELYEQSRRENERQRKEREEEMAE